jgi:hypothetical protein
MKLITERSEDVSYSIQEDATSGKKKLYVEGIYMQAERTNRNGRVYTKPILESAVRAYDHNFIQKNRAISELGHPASPQVNLDRVSHRITELHWDGNNVMGKAIILDTPMGQIARGLIEGGTMLGISSRGMGSLEKKGQVSYVKEDYTISAIDLVSDPSAPEAFVNGIMEGVEFFIENGIIRAESIKEQFDASPYILQYEYEDE